MSSERRPIGWWLKRLDGLIEDAFERAFASARLGRRHWQILSLAAAGPTAPEAIDTALAPFLAGDPDAARVATDELERRGWMRRIADGRLELTEAGRDGRDAVQRRVEGIRKSLRRGIDDDEYLAVIATLERMAANLAEDAAGRDLLA